MPDIETKLKRSLSWINVNTDSAIIYKVACDWISIDFDIFKQCNTNYLQQTKLFHDFFFIYLVQDYIVLFMKIKFKKTLTVIKSKKKWVNY